MSFLQRKSSASSGEHPAVVKLHETLRAIEGDGLRRLEEMDEELRRYVEDSTVPPPPSPLKKTRRK